MKYLCLCYYNPARFVTLSPTESAEIAAACSPYDEALHQTGRLVAQGSLVLPREWKTLRPSKNGPSVSDGPYQDTPGQAGAFLVIEAASVEEAVHVASKHAAANYGASLGFAVEVRACDTFEWGPAADCRA